jgi:hypothetical protein
MKAAWWFCTNPCSRASWCAWSSICAVDILLALKGEALLLQDGDTKRPPIRSSVAARPTDTVRSVGGHPSIARPPDLRGIFVNPQRKIFSLLHQSVATALHSVGTVGTGLALLLIEQMLKRVTNSTFFNFNFLGEMT